MPRLHLATAALALSAAALPARAHAQRSLAYYQASTSQDGTGPACGTDLATAWQDGARTDSFACTIGDPFAPLVGAGMSIDILTGGPPAAYHFTTWMDLNAYTDPFASIAAQVGYGDIIWWDDPRIATMEVLPSLHGTFWQNFWLFDPLGADASRVTSHSYASIGFAGSPYPTQPGIPSNDFACTTNSGTFPVWIQSVANGESNSVAVDWTLDRDTPIICQSNTTDATGRRGVAIKTYANSMTQMVYDQQFDEFGNVLPYTVTVWSDFSNTGLVELRFRDAAGHLIDDPQYSSLSGVAYAAAPPGLPGQPPVSPVPEPATAALVGGGLALLAAAARRRSATA